MRSISTLAAAVAVAGLAVASAAPAQASRTFDLVTFTPPKGFQVVDKADAEGRVELVKSSATSYCMVVLYSSTPASRDLDASFAAEWQAVALKSIAAVPAPAPVTKKFGDTRAAVGSTTSTTGGQPVAVRMIVLDAGAKVMSILVLTPTVEAYADYEPAVEKMFGALSVARVKGPEAAPVAAAPAAGSAPEIVDGRLVIPPAPASLSVADLAGEWGHNDGITTSYVDRYTGAYAGTDSFHFTGKWLITAQGGISLDFFGIRNGKKIVEKSSGTVKLEGRILIIQMTNRQRYVVRGWLERPEMTILTLNGPWYDDPIPENILTNPEQGTNLNKNWVRTK